MPSLIANTQSAFIGDCQILDPVLIANEAVEGYRARKKKGWVLKLDLEKGFNRVDWSYLESSLPMMGFHPKWIEWIDGCIRNAMFFVFINGRPRGRNSATRGIQQGDLLSPFSFLIISELLSSLISQIHGNGLFEGLLVGKDKMHLSILQLLMIPFYFANLMNQV